MKNLIVYALVVCGLAAAAVLALDVASRRGVAGRRLAIDAAAAVSPAPAQSCVGVPRPDVAPDGSMPLVAPAHLFRTSTTPGASRATFELSYPVFIGGDADDLNNSLTKILCELLEVDGAPESAADGFFAEHAAVVADAPGYDAPWHFSAKVSCEGTVGGVVCLEVSHHGFSGGAHDFYGSRFVLLDADTGLVVDWKKLIVPGRMSAFVAVAEKHFRAEAGLGAHDDLKDAGFWFEGGTFSLVGAEVGLTPRGTVIHFNPYAVASYAQGSVTFVVPMSALAGLIDLDTALAQAGRRLEVF